MTGATRVLRVISMCVVPGNTASWPCGRSRTASAAFSTWMKSVSPTSISTGRRTPRSWLSVQPVNDCTSPLVLCRDGVERARIGCRREVGVADRLEVVRRRQPGRVGLAATIVAVVGRGQDGPADPVRVRDHQLVAGEPADTETKDVGSLDPQVVEQGHHVGRKVGEGRGTVDVGGAAVALELDRDHPMVFSERRQGDAEVQLDGHQTAVEEHQRRPLAVLLVVEVQPVDICVRHAPNDAAAVANSSRHSPYWWRRMRASSASRSKGGSGPTWIVTSTSDGGAGAGGA